MSAPTFLDELQRAGIRLRLSGDALIANVLPRADLDAHRARITAHRPEIVAALCLQDAIVTAATAATAAFDRQGYDQLWAEWYALEEQEIF